jgi:hypothetical protein
MLRDSSVRSDQELNLELLGFEANELTTTTSGGRLQLLKLSSTSVVYIGARKYKGLIWNIARNIQEV